MSKPTNSKFGDRQRRIFNAKGMQISLKDFDSSDDAISYQPKFIQKRLNDY